MHEAEALLTMSRPVVSPLLLPQLLPIYQSTVLMPGEETLYEFGPVGTGLMSRVIGAMMKNGTEHAVVQA